MGICKLDLLTYHGLKGLVQYLSVGYCASLNTTTLMHKEAMCIALPVWFGVNVVRDSTGFGARIA